MGLLGPFKTKTVFIGSRPTKRKNVDNIQSLRAIPWVFAWTQIRLMLPAWLGTTEALRYGSIKKFSKTLTDMERNWPYFVSTMDILDMVISKVDPQISVIYENNLADQKLKKVGEKLRSEFDIIKSLNKIITPKEIINQRKQFRTSVIVRNIYSEILNILQAVIMKKLSKGKINPKQKKSTYLAIQSDKYKCKMAFLSNNGKSSKLFKKNFSGN